MIASDWKRNRKSCSVSGTGRIVQFSLSGLYTHSQKHIINEIDKEKSRLNECGPTEHYCIKIQSRITKKCYANLVRRRQAISCIARNVTLFTLTYQLTCLQLRASHPLSNPLTKLWIVIRTEFLQSAYHRLKLAPHARDAWLFARLNDLIVIQLDHHDAMSPCEVSMTVVSSVQPGCQSSMYIVNRVSRHHTLDGKT